MSRLGLVAGVLVAFCGNAAGTLTRTLNPGSIATCDVRSVSKSSSLSVSIAESAVEKIDAVLCGPEDVVHDHAASSAHAIATAFAEAITDVAAECYAKGTASFKVKGKSVASAQAHAIAQAYAAAYATAETCHKCSAVSELMIKSYEDIFLTAVSESTLELEAITDGEEVSAAATAFTRTFIEKTVVAFAEALVTARAAADSCHVAAITKTETGDIEDSNAAVCKIGVVSADDEKIANGAVAIATSVSARACGKGFTTTSFKVEAEALGKVMAIAVSEITADCHVKGKGTACVLGKSHMEKTAEAVATAFASAFAIATNDCENLCDSDTSIVSDAIGSVLAKATSHVYKEQCEGPDSYIDIKVIDKEIVEATTKALASILTEVSVSTEGECDIHIEVETSVTPNDQQVVDEHDGPYLPPHKDIHEPHPDPPHPDPPAQKKSHGSPGQKRPPLKSGFKRRHGKVVNKQSAQDRSHPKRAAKQPKKAPKQNTRPRGPVRGKTKKVLPKHKLNAAQLALVRKKARAMQRRKAAQRKATRGRNTRRAPRNTRTRSLRKTRDPRAPRRSRPTSGRKPRKPRKA